jgi:hypothetical protein
VAPRFLACAARGELRVEVEPVPIADVEQAWTLDARGRRIVFTT